MATNRLAFARALLVRGHFQRGPEYEKCLVAIMAAEGSLAWWNPLDTTLRRGGAEPYNSFGPGGSEHVWNYANAASGVEATVLTMMQPNMHEWVAMMRQPGRTAVELLQAFARTPWGGVGDTLPLRVALGWRTSRLAYIHDRRSIVAGHGPWTYKRNGAPRR